MQQTSEAEFHFAPELDDVKVPFEFDIVEAHHLVLGDRSYQLHVVREANWQAL